MVAAGPAALASAIPSDIENATAAPNIASCLVMVCIFLIRPEGPGINRLPRDNAWFRRQSVRENGVPRKTSTPVSSRAREIFVKYYDPEPLNRLSRIMIATIRPERKLSAAIAAMAETNPKRSAMSPAASAPTA